MAWPNEPCPPNHPNHPPHPTAAQHLDWIKAKAEAELVAKSPLLVRIQAAINACRTSHCKLTGNAPADPEHGQDLLWARCLACESNWGACADELEHGV